MSRVELDEIVALVRELSPCSSRDISERVEVYEHSTVINMVRELVRRGKIHRRLNLLDTRQYIYFVEEE